MDDPISLALTTATAAEDDGVRSERLDRLTLLNCSMGNSGDRYRIDVEGRHISRISTPSDAEDGSEPGAFGIDLEGRSLLPGMFLVWAGPGPRGVPTASQQPDGVVSTVLDLATVCVRLGGWGFTSVVSLGRIHPRIGYAYKQARSEGLFIGPALLTAGRPVRWDESAIRSELEEAGYRYARYLDEADLLLVAARRTLGEGADLLYLDPESPNGDMAPLDALIRVCEAARLRGKAVVGVARRPRGVEALADAGVNLVQFHGEDLSDKVLELLQRSETGLLSGFAEPYGRANTRSDSHPESPTWTRRSMVKRAADLGVRIVAGGASSLESDPYEEMRALGSTGLPTSAVVEAVTAAPADAFHQALAGRLLEGKEANMVATSSMMWESATPVLPALVVIADSIGITCQIRPPLTVS